MGRSWVDRAQTAILYPFKVLAVAVIMLSTMVIVDQTQIEDPLFPDAPVSVLTWYQFLGLSDHRTDIQGCFVKTVVFLKLRTFTQHEAILADIWDQNGSRGWLRIERGSKNLRPIKPEDAAGATQAQSTSQHLSSQAGQATLPSTSPETRDPLPSSTPDQLSDTPAVASSADELDGPSPDLRDSAPQDAPSHAYSGRRLFRTMISTSHQNSSSATSSARPPLQLSGTEDETTNSESGTNEGVRPRHKSHGRFLFRFSRSAVQRFSATASPMTRSPSGTEDEMANNSESDRDRSPKPFYADADDIVRKWRSPFGDPKTAPDKSIIETITYQANNPTLIDLILAANTVHSMDERYRLLDRQCFWFADSILVILESLAGRSNCVVTPGRCPRIEKDKRLPSESEAKRLSRLKGRWGWIQVHRRDIIKEDQLMEQFSTWKGGYEKYLSKQRAKKEEEKEKNVEEARRPLEKVIKEHKRELEEVRRPLEKVIEEQKRELQEVRRPLEKVIEEQAQRIAQLEAQQAGATKD